MSFINFIRITSPAGETWEEYSRRKWGVGVTRYHGWLDGKVTKAWTKVLSRPDATLRWKALLKKGWRETQRRNPQGAAYIQFIALDQKAGRFVLRRKKHRITAARVQGGKVHVLKGTAKSRWHDHEVFLPGIDTRTDLKRKKIAARKFLNAQRKALLG